MPAQLSPAVSGGWYGSDLAHDPDAWRVPLPAEVNDDLLRAAAALEPGGLATPGADPLQRRPAVSMATRSLVGEVRRRLAGEPGLVVLTGFPVHEDLAEAAYVVLMMLIGQPVLQRLDDELIVRVEAGPDASAPGAGRIGITRAMPPHVDRAADLVGLLCIRPAESGGTSLAVSSKTVYNIMLERHPELLAALCRPVPMHVPAQLGPRGEVAPRWCELPMFSRVGDHFASYFNRLHIEQTQQFPDAPRITSDQAAAVDAVEEVGRIPELRLEMPLRPGDLQVVNNLSVAHARTAYDSDSSGKGRLLLRMHAAFGGSPELPRGYAAIFGSSTAGTYRGGLWQTHEVRERFGTPLPVAQAA
ncbi:MAG TPA: TauD/TfdA family dioxygenase [Pseudonocardiaceae bacterium]|nr:TauD/TfdA family dioxygenase [Pseudonocardiaceae bacterium]